MGSEDNGFHLLCLRDTLHNKMVMLKLGLDHLKFKNSENGDEMERFWPKIEFHKKFSFFGQYLVESVTDTKFEVIRC